MTTADFPVPQAGSDAPDFELSNQHGEPIRLSSLRGQNVVLMFYPFAFSGTCTSELSEIRDNLPEFTAVNASVLAVSVDSKFSLRAYADKQGYEFDLLADFWPHGAVASLYGVFDTGKGMAGRGTFIIDTEGVIRHVMVNPPDRPRKLEEYREALAGLTTAASGESAPVAAGSVQG